MLNEGELVGRRSWWSIVSKIVSTLFWSCLWLVFIALILLRLFVYQQVNVVGHSMDPNYTDGQMLVINRTEKDLQRGQVVAVYADKETALNANYFTPYDATNTFFLKRVIGLPGESIELLRSKVIIYNQDYPEGAILQEDYISPEVIRVLETDKAFAYFPKVQIEKDSYFLMGDNRSQSLDSRNKGTFPKYTVFGKEVLRYWPFEQGKIFRLPQYSFKPLDSATRAELEQARRERGIRH